MLLGESKGETGTVAVVHEADWFFDLQPIILSQGGRDAKRARGRARGQVRNQDAKIEVRALLSSELSAIA